MRIEQPRGRRILNLAEIEVFQGDDNLARRGRATIHPAVSPYPAANLIDGITTDPKNFGAAQWVIGGYAEIELPSAERIDRVVVWNRVQGSFDLADRLLPIDVKVLDDRGRTVWQHRVLRARIQNRNQARAGDSRFQKIEIVVGR